MAALETPWLSQMSNPKVRPENPDALTATQESTTLTPATHAAFSPVTALNKPPGSTSAKRSTILVHQKSPLLLATPPQVTRALAYSHPFLLPLNKAAGLVTWTTGDPWESFLVVAGYWAVVLYGDVILRLAGPVVVVLGLIVGMYGRRFSPLSSSGAVGGSSVPGKTPRDTGDTAPGKTGKTAREDTNTRHQKTLDEIVETLREFTARCNILLEPMLRLTDFLSTQRTPTSATVRPALTILFTRILFCTPFWYALTLPPLRIITTKRIMMVFGTLILTWHSRPMRVARTLLWRSRSVRRAAGLVTGLQFDLMGPGEIGKRKSMVNMKGEDKGEKKVESELTKQIKGGSHLQRAAARAQDGRDAGVKFTFIIYENQRRWLGLGWTNNLFAYERAAWTDEHNTAVPSREEFELPDVEEGVRMRWRWVPGSRWRVDGVTVPAGVDEIDWDGEQGKMGWVYYDNKWQNGRRGQDGWVRWTRRRKWYRDAELVDLEEDENLGKKKVITTGYSPAEKMITPATAETGLSTSRSPSVASHLHFHEEVEEEPATLSSSPRSFFKQPRTIKRREAHLRKLGEPDDEGEGLPVELEMRKGGGWGIGDEAHMSLE